jgi:type 1 glutamine amidotransferase
VLVSGDEEYRSEEVCPMLGKILAVRHGFTCTVLFAIDPESGAIDPAVQTHIPGLGALEEADLMVVFTRFRELPDQDMRHFDAYVQSGRPIVGLRTATHAFDYRRNPESPYARYSWDSAAWPGGFGRQVLGETWVSHHGAHGRESTRGVVEPERAGHPVLRGVADVWGPTDVYTAQPPPDAVVLLRGQVLDGMQPGAARLAGSKNDPCMPIAWVRRFTGRAGVAARVFCTTMGAATDLESEGLRRLVVNACYWAMGLEDAIPAGGADVDYVGEYAPSPFGFGGAKRGVFPADHRLEPVAEGR